MEHIKNFNPSIKIASALLFSIGLVFPLAPTYASDPAIVNQAQELCVSKAKAKGFDLKEIIYSGGADVAGKDAKIVLNLTKDGQLFKLTCYYHKASGQVDLGDNVAADVANVAPSIPWWWLLLPLIGMVLLLAWARNRDKALGVVGRSGHQYEAYIRGNSTEPVRVYASPSYNSSIIKAAYNGQKVIITDRDITTETGNWIELASGGWVPEQYVGTSARSL